MQSTKGESDGERDRDNRMEMRDKRMEMRGSEKEIVRETETEIETERISLTFMYRSLVSRGKFAGTLVKFLSTHIVLVASPLPMHLQPSGH